MPASTVPTPSRLPLLLLLLTILARFTSAIPHSLPVLSIVTISHSTNPNLSASHVAIQPIQSTSPELLDASPLDLSRPTRRQSQAALASLQIPTCALTCYINTLTTDGCASETDFACHCSKGDILGKAEACIEKGCDEGQKKDAEDKMGKACDAAGGGNGGNGRDGNGSGGEGSTTGTGSPSGTVTMSRSGSPGSGTATSSSTSPATTPTSSPSPVAPTSSSPSSSHSNPSDQPAPTSSPPMPTDTPLALLPPNRQLSPAAKAGISVSVSVFASAILLTIYLYIRRLKKDLALAKAAAGVPESVWRASIETAAAPVGVGRRRSWGGRGRRRSGAGGAGGSWSDNLGSPVSPLSPRGGMESSMASVLKKKRGHVLSVVVEREEEDNSSQHRIIHEPVPGQKEGLVDPLELDGEYTGIVELPTSVTPRTRSMERSRERGASLGESSRPSTGGLERIDERQGV
ncbi:hypothetical protein K458DRAFT_388544 [Lentithecium fluviatile CBS 122367]|uniref:CFEM domain-containing protein n=1 Tax=Lentithecium fluviatile CBS 122367 TaxID=1168545 RepID=A0A6G1J3Q6_9PLEO|nr:hypothetical protein K458DRAFT_388544 [Lentithecium fluviatile CBS 122367]